MESETVCFRQDTSDKEQTARIMAYETWIKQHLLL